MKKIVLKEDFDAELQIFLDFLNNKEYPQHRNIIFSSFPELKEKIELNTGNEKGIVETFLNETRKNNKDKIRESVSYIREEIEKKGEETLKILSELMNYTWKSSEEDYFLIPTIFPLSPFKKNTFFFSIYKSLKGDTKYPKVLAVSAHEISHMILFDILKEINIGLGQELLYFIKELIAPILVFQDDFKDIFKKEIVGNYNVLEIYFEKNGKTVKAFDYFLEMFGKNRRDKENFKSFVINLINTCQGIEEEIKEKRSFDNKYGMQMMKDQELLKKFREPIKLK